MDEFTFLHAADLHLDSPLLGLAQKSPEQARRVADASRLAFENLISLAIEEKCRFVLFAGDLFDGDWKDYRTGTFFAAQMRRLQDADVLVYAILGNHDAENRFVTRLDLSENVHLFGSKSAQSIEVPNLAVTIHGLSYPQRDVTENIAASYPSPATGRFNIGLLHTACNGRAGHAPYAPCTVEQLASHGYQYWALGHVHAREVLSEDPHIIYPGNLQGRNPRETGPKGATLVRVADGAVVAHEHRPLDAVRWMRSPIDVSGARTRTEILDSVRRALKQIVGDADGRALAVRLSLMGETDLHAELVATRTDLRDEIETTSAGISDDLWIEKVELATTPPRAVGTLDASIAGQIEAAIADPSQDAMLAEVLDRLLTAVKAKFPAAAHLDQLETSLKENAIGMARQLAASTLARASKLP